MSFIEAHALTRRYRKGAETITPIADLDLEIARGEFVALMGPSGSGKTTLLNLLAGIDQASSGRLTIGGAELTAMSSGRLTSWRARHVGYIFQLYNLVPVLTAYENVELPLLLQPLSRRQRHEKIALALELVGLSDRHAHYPRQLSGGQEQRVAIARAIVADPPLLVCDEPTGDLDRKAATAVLELLQQLNQQLDKTLVMVTHDPRAATYAHRTLALADGRIVPASSEADLAYTEVNQ